MGKLTIFDHPLITHKITMMRRKETSTRDFRELAEEITLLMAYEVTRDLPLEEVDIETPICRTKGYEVSGSRVCVVPILRAGLGMVNGILTLIPNAKVGHIGLYRDKVTHQPVEYYFKLPPDAPSRRIIVVDPMLATGGSAVAAIQFIKDRGCKDIKLMCLIGVQEGIDAVQKAHPDVDIYLASKDGMLNDHAYIVPGLGDAGDRIFGTK